MDALTVVLRVEARDGPVFRDAVRSVFTSTHLPQALVLAVDGAVLANVEAALPSLVPATVSVEVIGVDPETAPGAVRAACFDQIRTPLVLCLPAVARLDPTLIEKAVWALAGRADWSFVSAGPAPHKGRPGALAQHLKEPDEIVHHRRLCPVSVSRLSALRAVAGADASETGTAADWDEWLRLAAAGLWGGTLAEPLVALAPAPGAAEGEDPGPEVRSRLRQRDPDLWSGRFASIVHRPQPVDAGEPSRAATAVADPAPIDPAHLLLVLPWLNLGGADRFNLNLTAELVRRGHRVTIATTNLSPDPWADGFRQHTPDLFSLPRFLRPEQQPAFLRHLIESRAIRVCLISHSMLGYGCLPFLREHCPATVFVDYTHFVASDWESGGFAGMAHQHQAQLDLNLVSSQQLKAWMVDQGSDPERIAVVRTGQDLATLDPKAYDRPALRQQFGIADDTAVLLYPARLDPQKRPLFTLTVLRALKEMDTSKRQTDSASGPASGTRRPSRGASPPRWVCLIAGDGPQHQMVKWQIRLRGLAREVRVLGTVPPERMPELYAASDILILPSQDEGISLALLEAMSMELPVVAADVGGQRELVTAETGVLIARGGDERSAYAAAIADLVANPSQRRQLGAAGRAQVQAHFALQPSTDALLAALARARDLHQHQPRPVPSPAEVEAATASIIADLRADRLQERLRGAPASTTTAPPSALGWFKRRVLRPVYVWALRNGLDFVVPLASWVLRRYGRLLR